MPFEVSATTTTEAPTGIDGAWESVGTVIVPPEPVRYNSRPISVETIVWFPLYGITDRGPTDAAGIVAAERFTALPGIEFAANECAAPVAVMFPV